MQRHQLLSAIPKLEQELGRNPYHINGSRRKYLDTIYLSEAADELLFAFHAHLENVLAVSVAEQIVADVLRDVQLDDGARKRIGKLIMKGE